MASNPPSDRSPLQLGLPAEEFFGEVVDAAVSDRGMEASADSRVYLVALLADHARRPQLQQVGEPFGERLVRAMQTSGGERFERLRRLGDDVLFISGFYSDYLEHRGLQPDYVVSLGSVAYGGVASILRSHAGGPVVFDELSRRFAAFVEVLQHASYSLLAAGLRDGSSLRDSTELLALYERWSRTGSSVLGEALVRLGVMPGRGTSGLN